LISYLAGEPISKASIFKSDPHPSKMRPYKLLLGVLVRMRTGEISNSIWDEAAEKCGEIS
jgi:hypothetical protein